MWRTLSSNVPSSEDSCLHLEGQKGVFIINYT